MTALHHRKASGVGQIVDVALYEAAFSQMEGTVPAYDKLGVVPQRQGPNLPGMAPNSLYPSADGGYVLIAANSEATFERLLAAMQQPALRDDPRFATVRARGIPENMAALDGVIAQWAAQLDGDTIEQRLLAERVPVSRVYTIADIFADPHYAARGMLVDVPHPVLGSVRQVGVVPKLSVTPGRVTHAGPEIGADNASVLAELGYDAQRIDALRAEGVIGDAHARTHAA
jgi:crotonobetainyl-CoA:carnitine CoA-transferase CaiB-like acyl-CoA transferase